MKRLVVRQARPIRQLLFEDGHDPFAAPGQFSRRHRQLRILFGLTTLNLELQPKVPDNAPISMREVASGHGLRAQR